MPRIFSTYQFQLGVLLLACGQALSRQMKRLGLPAIERFANLYYIAERFLKGNMIL
jgi:hypothetical protein